MSRLTEPAGRPSPGRASEPARTKEPIVHFPVQLCASLSRKIIPSRHPSLLRPFKFALHFAILCDPPVRPPLA